MYVCNDFIKLKIKSSQDMKRGTSFFFLYKIRISRATFYWKWIISLTNSPCKCTLAEARSMSFSRANFSRPYIVGVCLRGRKRNFRPGRKIDEIITWEGSKAHCADDVRACVRSGCPRIARHTAWAHFHHSRFTFLPRKRVELINTRSSHLFWP